MQKEEELIAERNKHISVIHGAVHLISLCLHMCSNPNHNIGRTRTGLVHSCQHQNRQMGEHVIAYICF